MIGLGFFDLPFFFEAVLRLFLFSALSFFAHIYSSFFWLGYPMLKVRYSVCMSALRTGLFGANPSNEDKGRPLPRNRNTFYT